jgi:hypothetical protein
MEMQRRVACLHRLGRITLGKDKPEILLQGSPESSSIVDEMSYIDEYIKSFRIQLNQGTRWIRE